jgi:hypothetical protein
MYLRYREVRHESEPSRLLGIRRRVSPGTGRHRPVSHSADQKLYQIVETGNAVDIPMKQRSAEFLLQGDYNFDEL